VIPAGDPMPPPELSRTVGRPERFREVGEEFLGYFVDLCGLRPDERVLDVGSGVGRIALPLTGYLEGGGYEGFDVIAASVRWCQENITPRHPSFVFRHADVFNGSYNPTGTIQAEDFEFPYETASFDFVYLASVFTHMLPPGVERYLSECGRVLRPGGRMLATFFLLNDETSLLLQHGEGAEQRFDHELGRCKVTVLDDPEALVAYEEHVVRQLIAAAGLSVQEPIRYGRWPGRETFLSGQDVVLATR
jgi:SAM-dependent methyltransferase